MKLFKYEVTFEHLLMLVAILYVIFFFMQKRENFEQEQSKKEDVKKDSRCGEESIDYGYLHYIFNSPAVPRR